MPRRELHTSDVKIEQKPVIDLATIDPTDRDPEIIRADPAALQKDYADALAFNEEPVEIHIEPGTGDFAPTHHYCAVNGKGAEARVGSRWVEFSWLPVNQTLIVKRKYVENLLRSKVDKVETIVPNVTDTVMNNRIRRVTTGACTFSIIRDDNPKGRAWFERIRRQNF